MLCGECDLDCETNLKINFFEVLHCWELLDEEKIGGENCGLLVEISRVYGTLILLLS